MSLKRLKTQTVFIPQGALPIIARPRPPGCVPPTADPSGAGDPGHAVLLIHRIGEFIFPLKLIILNSGKADPYGAITTIQDAARLSSSQITVV